MFIISSYIFFSYLHFIKGGMRCRAILLKSEGFSSVCVGEQTEMTVQSVNGWVKRFESEGIKGLYTRPGQGRKPILFSFSHICTWPSS